ncbi:MAG: glycosyltransferase family 39 protein [Patescibacteria group bacterium]
MLLYGTLAKIFSLKAIIYFTPLFSILGVLAFFGICKRIFNEKIALISAILMLAHPAWWYYSVASMLPNVTFISLILLSIYFLFQGQKLKISQTLLAAFFAGLALSIRPSEIIWLIVVYLVVIIYLQGKLKLRHLILFLAIAFLVFLPSLYQQRILFGDFLTSGYSQLQDNQSGVCQSCQMVKSVILPFGFHPALAAYNFWTHYLSRLWWFSLLAILGLVAFLTQKGRQKIEIFGYILFSLFSFGWLIIYYGSWQFSDLLTVHLNTLGLSYVRYWLPLYLLALPFVALSLLVLTNFLKNRWQNLVLALLLVALFYPSACLVLAAKPDSILPVRERIYTYKQTAQEVINLTEPGSVIVTVRKDKVFFPERKVIHTFDALSLNQELLTILPDLTKVVPLYYYALGPEPTLEFDNGLKLEPIKNIGQEVLYRVENQGAGIKN